MTNDSQWLPIDDDAPRDVNLLLWWVPVEPNRFAEACVIGQISSYQPGKWWNGQTGTYQDLNRVTHYMKLPAGPNR
jgi:hypothetical protein